MPHEIEILKVAKVPAGELARAGQMDTVVIFLRDKDQTDMVTIPRDTSDLEEVKQAITAELAARDQITGKKFTLP